MVRYQRHVEFEYGDGDGESTTAVIIHIQYLDTLDSSMEYLLHLGCFCLLLVQWCILNSINNN